jgi:DNA-binding XRE family transcriptional regulator
MTIERDDLIPAEQVFRELGLPDRLSYGLLVRTWRKCDGLTQVEAARQLGISKQLLSAYETGKQLPSLRQGTDIATTLGLYMPQAIRALIEDHVAQAGLTGYTIEVRQSA